MADTYIQRMKEKAQEFGWAVSVDADVEFYKHSPAGEDFCFAVTKGENIAEGVREYAEDFDTEEHIMMWVVAKQNGSVSGIPDIKTLVRDADDIKLMLKELADAVENIWHCTGCAYFDACGNYEKTEHCNGRKLVK